MAKFDVRVFQTKAGLLGIECPGMCLDRIDKLERNLVRFYNRNSRQFDSCATVGDVNRALEQVVAGWLERGVIDP